MLRTIEVEVDSAGRLRVLEPMGPLPARRALLTLLTPDLDEATQFAEGALVEDWLRPQEDEAWAHLQPGK